jgi:hypothetical protein
LALGDLADEDLAVLRDADDRGGRAAALGVRNHRGLARLQHGHHGVRGAEVDPYCSCHLVSPLFMGRRAPGAYLSLNGG